MLGSPVGREVELPEVEVLLVQLQMQVRNLGGPPSAASRPPPSSPTAHTRCAAPEKTA